MEAARGTLSSSSPPQPPPPVAPEDAPDFRQRREQSTTLLKFYGLAALLSLSPQRYRRLLLEERIRDGFVSSGGGGGSMGAEEERGRGASPHPQPRRYRDPAPASSSPSSPPLPPPWEARALVNALVEAIAYPFLSTSASSSSWTFLQRLSEGRAAGGARGDTAPLRVKWPTSSPGGSPSPSSSPQQGPRGPPPLYAARAPTPPALALNANAFPAAASDHSPGAHTKGLARTAAGGPTAALVSSWTDEAPAAERHSPSSPHPAGAAVASSGSREESRSHQASAAAIASHFDSLYNEVVTRSPLKGPAATAAGVSLAVGSSAPTRATATAAASPQPAVGNPELLAERFLLLSPFANDRRSRYVDAHSCYSGVSTEQLIAELAEPQFDRFYRYMHGGTPLPPPSTSAFPLEGGGVSERTLSPTAALTTAKSIAVSAATSSGGDGGSYLDAAAGHYVSSSGLPLYAPPESLRRHHQAFLQLLPPILHTSSGVAHVSRICPALLPSLLEVLLKGSGFLAGTATAMDRLEATADRIRETVASAVTKVAVTSQRTPAQPSPADPQTPIPPARVDSAPPPPSSPASGTTTTTTTAIPEPWTSARRSFVHLLEQYATVLAGQQRYLRRLRHELTSLVLRVLSPGEAAALPQFLKLAKYIVEDALPLAHALVGLRATAVSLLPMIQPSNWALSIAATMLLARVFGCLDHIGDGEGGTSPSSRFSRVSVLQETDKLLVYGTVVAEVAVRLTAAGGGAEVGDAVGLMRLHSLLAHIDSDNDDDDGGAVHPSPTGAKGCTAVGGTDQHTNSRGSLWAIDAEALASAHARQRAELATLMDELEGHAQEVAQDVGCWSSSVALVVCLVTVTRQQEEAEEAEQASRQKKVARGDSVTDGDEPSLLSTVSPANLSLLEQDRRERGDVPLADASASHPSAASTPVLKGSVVSPRGPTPHGVDSTHHGSRGATVSGTVVAVPPAALSAASSLSHPPVRGVATTTAAAAGGGGVGGQSAALPTGTPMQRRDVKGGAVSVGTLTPPAAPLPAGSPVARIVAAPLSSPTANANANATRGSLSRSPPATDGRAAQRARRQLLWRLPERVPAQVTPAHTAILTSMTLTLGSGAAAAAAAGHATSQRTVAALGQWFVQSLVMHLADPVAVAGARQRAGASLSVGGGVTSAAALPQHGSRLPIAKVSSACVALTHLLQQHLPFFSKAVLGGATLASLRTVTASLSSIPSPTILLGLVNGDDDDERNSTSTSHHGGDTAGQGNTASSGHPVFVPTSAAVQPPTTSYNINLDANTLLSNPTASPSSDQREVRSGKGSVTTAAPPPAPPPVLAAPSLGSDPVVMGNTARITDVLVRVACLIALRLLQQQRITMWSRVGVAAPPSARNDNGAEEEAEEGEKGEGEGEPPSRTALALLSELHEVHYALHLLLQSVLTHQPGEPLSAETQHHLGLLCLSWFNVLLHVEHSRTCGGAGEEPPQQQRQQRRRGADAATAAAVPPPLLATVEEIRARVRKGFCWVVIAVNHVLHIYDVADGSPLHLCAALAPLAQRVPTTTTTAAATARRTGEGGPAPQRTLLDIARGALVGAEGGAGESLADTPSPSPSSSSSLPLVLRECVLPALAGIEAVAEASLFLLSPSATALPVSLRPHEHYYRRQQQQQQQQQHAQGRRSSVSRQTLFLGLSHVKDDEDGLPTVFGDDGSAWDKGDGGAASFAEVYATPSSLAALKQFLKAEVLSVERGSLLGILPCSPYPFTLSARRRLSCGDDVRDVEGPTAAVNGGLWTHQRVDWAVSFLGYLDRQWWYARANTPATGLVHRSPYQSRHCKRRARAAMVAEGEARFLGCPLSAKEVMYTRQTTGDTGNGEGGGDAAVVASSRGYLDGCLSLLREAPAADGSVLV